MKKHTSLLFLLMFLFSCADDIEMASDSNGISKNTSKNSYSIPIDSALANLNDFLDASEEPATRTHDKRVVSSVASIRYNRVKTRSDADSINCDTILYIANFEGDAGYAVLAADKRIIAKVIAITDNGSLDDVTIYNAISLANAERVIIDGYPLTGDGFITTSETGEELFLNPNTVILYNDSIQDTFVGNFSLDNEGATDENGNAVPDDTTTIYTPELITSSLCVSYAINEIGSFKETHLYYHSMSDDNDIDDSGGGYVITTETTASAWSVKKQMPPILTDFVS